MEVVYVHDIVRDRPGPWTAVALILLAVMSTPALAQADLVCPGCDTQGTVLQLSEVLDLVLGALLRHGIALLLMGSVALVGLPWVIAAVAVAVIYLPRWLKASS